MDIEDNNDNNPIFTTSSYQGNQMEGSSVGSSIVTVLATDADQTGSNNALVEYSLSGQHSMFFNVDPTSGVISNNIILVSVTTPTHTHTHIYIYMYTG